MLGRQLAFHGGDQVEFYTLEAAAALMPHPTTWPLAAAYLAWCPTHGQAALQAMLRRLPLQAGDPWVARKAIEIAEHHGLPRLVEGAAGSEFCGGGVVGRVGVGVARFLQKL